MLLSAYAALTGKWAIVGMGMFGWCCWATPAIFRAAGNPGLTPAARKQMTLLALVCVIPLLITVVLIAFSNDDRAHGRTYPEKQSEYLPLGVEKRLPPVSLREGRVQLLPSRATLASCATHS